MSTLQMMRKAVQKLPTEQGNLLETPEDEFHRLIIQMEHNPLFRRLYQKEKLIHYRRFSRTDISSSFYQLKEEVVADRGSPSAESRRSVANLRKELKFPAARGRRNAVGG